MPLRRYMALAPLTWLLALGLSTGALAASVRRSQTNAVGGSQTTPASLPMYWQIDLAAVDSFLPQSLPIYGGAVRRQQYFDYFAPQLKDRTIIEKSLRYYGEIKGPSLIRLFEAGERYTYVITRKVMLLSKIRNEGVSSALRKHFVVANFADFVRFAGECWVNAEGQLVLNNNSGTYRPKAVDLARLSRLLTYNFGVKVTTEIYK